MTQNQIAFQQLAESNRHNIQDEYLNKYRTDSQASVARQQMKYKLAGDIVGAILGGLGRVGSSAMKFIKFK